MHYYRNINLHKPMIIITTSFDIPETFDTAWNTGLLHKHRPYGISSLVFGLISSFMSNRWLWVVLDRKPSKEFPVNAGVPQGSNLGSTGFDNSRTWRIHVLLSFRDVRVIVVVRTSPLRTFLSKQLWFAF